MFLGTYNCENWFENKELNDTKRKSNKEESIDLTDMPPLEGDEEVKEGKRLKTLTGQKIINWTYNNSVNKS